jgi:hypothetical protein
LQPERLFTRLLKTKDLHDIRDQPAYDDHGVGSSW